MDALAGATITALAAIVADRAQLLGRGSSLAMSAGAALVILLGLAAGALLGLFEPAALLPTVASAAS